MTVDVFQLAILLILALMLGVSIPVLIELKRFARAARKRIESTGPKVDRLVEDAQVSAKQFREVSEVFRGKEDELVRLRDSMTQAVEAFEKVQKGLQIGSAVGAAVAPAIATFLASMSDEHESNQAPEREREGRNPLEAQPSYPPDAAPGRQGSEAEHHLQPVTGLS